METENKIRQHLQPDINVGDKVIIWDGSYLTCETYPNEFFLIVSSYPEKLESEEKLKHLLGEVIKTNVTTNLTESFVDGIYQQDIQVSINGVIFNTCSGCVKRFENINESIKYISESKYYDKHKMMIIDYDDFFYNGNY